MWIRISGSGYRSEIGSYISMEKVKSIRISNPADVDEYGSFKYDTVDGVHIMRSSFGSILMKVI